MKEIFSDVFNAPISEGGIHYILDRLVTKVQPAYEMIKQRLRSNINMPLAVMKRYITDTVLKNDLKVLNSLKIIATL